MSSPEACASTPRYVLKSGSQPIFPTINVDEQQIKCVYGFSDKKIFDQFIKSASQPLTPYPLVKGYLSNQIDAADAEQTNGRHLPIVILDATNEKQAVVSAASMASVLLAMQEQEKQISIEYELVIDAQTNQYRLSNEAIDVEPPQAVK